MQKVWCTIAMNHVESLQMFIWRASYDMNCVLNWIILGRDFCSDKNLAP